jgi:hypothetical protein
VSASRRDFVSAETEHLGAFLGDSAFLVGWSRSYRCDCGFRCTAPGDIYDHSLVCEPAGQLPFGFATVDALTQSFCACGRVTSQCDRSRRGCGKGSVSP